MTPTYALNRTNIKSPILMMRSSARALHLRGSTQRPWWSSCAYNWYSFICQTEKYCMHRIQVVMMNELISLCAEEERCRRAVYALIIQRAYTNAICKRTHIPRNNLCFSYIISPHVYARTKNHYYYIYGTHIYYLFETRV